MTLLLLAAVGLGVSVYAVGVALVWVVEKIADYTEDARYGK